MKCLTIAAVGGRLWLMPAGAAAVAAAANPGRQPATPAADASQTTLPGAEPERVAYLDQPVVGGMETGGVATWQRADGLPGVWRD